MELEINDLEDTKLIIQKIKKLFGDKISVAEIMIEPCYSMIKKELYNKSFDEEESKNLENNNFNKNKSNDIKDSNIKESVNKTENNNKNYLDDNNIIINNNNNNMKDNNSSKKNINYINNVKNDYSVDEDQK